MNEPQTCRRCGATLPAGLFGGRCPKCLMRAGIESEASGPRAWQPPPIAELSGEFPQLELLELLGRGGMGAVYKARQPGLDRYVALKILPEEVGSDIAFAERFEREAKLLAQLDHPSIVRVYDAGRQGDRYYFLMEYVDGRNLRQLMRSSEIASAQALAIVTQVCEALQYAHDHGVVHRDIKPENIMVDTRGRVKIADFGLAKLAAQDVGGELLTRSDQVMGTMHYMSPEQLRRPLAVDHRSDIYSLGVVFYELLTGDVPVGAFPPPSATVSVDVRLDEVVLKSLAREPEQRYQRADDVRTDVQTVSSTPNAASAGGHAAASRGSTGGRQAGGRAERKKTPVWPFVLGGCLLLPLGLGAVGVLFLMVSSPRIVDSTESGPGVAVAPLPEPLPAPIPADSGTRAVELEPGEHPFKSEALLWRDDRPEVDFRALDRVGVDPAAAAQVSGLVELVWDSYRELEREATRFVEVPGADWNLMRYGIFGDDAPELVFEVEAFADARRELADLLEESLITNLGPETWHSIGGTNLTRDLMPFGEQLVIVALDRGPGTARVGVEVPGERHRDRVVNPLPRPLVRFFDQHAAGAGSESRR